MLKTAEREKINYSIAWIAAIVFMLCCGLIFRLYPVTVNIAQEKLRLSRLAVYINLKNQVAQTVRAALPGLPADVQQQLINRQFKKILEKERRAINKIAREIAAAQKERKPDFFPLEADSYYFYYLTENIIKTGHISDAISSGKYFDRLMMAPQGLWRKIEAHPYIGASIYRIVKIFKPDASLVYAISAVPLLVSIPALFLFLFICSTLKLKRFITFISAVFFYLAPIYIQRSSYGWYDTDPYNVLFLLAAIFIVMECGTSQSLHWPVFLAIVTSLYCLFWQGWLLLPLLCLISLISVLIFKITNHCRDVARLLKIIAIYTLGFLFFSACFLTPRGLLDSLRESVSIFSGFLFLNQSLWPDILLTVSELKRPSLSRLIFVLGGNVFIIAALLGFARLVRPRANRSDSGQGIVLCVFFVACLLITMNAERFMIFLLAPTALCGAVGLNFIYERLHLRFITFSKGRGRFIRAAIPSLFSLILIIPFFYANVTAASQVPIYNEVWDAALKKLRSLSSGSSIVNSWWPPGHFIKATAHRKVSFDGATINTPVSYWLACALLNENEQQAIGILRMINTSGTQAVDYLISNNIALPQAISLIKTLVAQSAPSALSAASRYLSPQQARHLLSLTHGNPPESYCMLYNDLVNNALGLRYVKEWDFDKALTLQTKRRQALRKGGLFWRGTKENILSLWSAAGGMPYIGSQTPGIRSSPTVISFSSGVTLHTDTMEASIQNLEGKLSGIPTSILYIEKGKLVEKSFRNASLKLSVLFIRHPNNTYSSIVAPAPILKSVLFRLYYADGLGLRNFRKVIAEEDLRLDTKIIIYSILWEAN